MSAPSPLLLAGARISNIRSALKELKSENTNYLSSMSIMIDSTSKVFHQNTKLEHGITQRRKYYEELNQKILKAPELIQRLKQRRNKAAIRLKKYQKQITERTNGVNLDRIKTEIETLINKINNIKKETQEYKMKVKNEKVVIDQILQLNGLKHELISMNKSLTDEAFNLLGLIDFSKINMPPEIENQISNLRDKMAHTDYLKRRLNMVDSNYDEDSGNSNLYQQMDDRLKEALPIFNHLESMFNNSSVNQSKLTNGQLSELVSELVSDSTLSLNSNYYKEEANSNAKSSVKSFPKNLNVIPIEDLCSSSEVDPSSIKESNKGSGRIEPPNHKVPASRLSYFDNLPNEHSQTITDKTNIPKRKKKIKQYNSELSHTNNPTLKSQHIKSILANTSPNLLKNKRPRSVVFILDNDNPDFKKIKQARSSSSISQISQNNNNDSHDFSYTDQKSNNTSHHRKRKKRRKSHLDDEQKSKDTDNISGKSKTSLSQRRSRSQSVISPKSNKSLQHESDSDDDQQHPRSKLELAEILTNSMKLEQEAKSKPISNDSRGQENVQDKVHDEHSKKKRKRRKKPSNSSSHSTNSTNSTNQIPEVNDISSSSDIPNENQANNIDDEYSHSNKDKNKPNETKSLNQKHGKKIKRKRRKSSNTTENIEKYPSFPKKDSNLHQDDFKKHSHKHRSKSLQKTNCNLSSSKNSDIFCEESTSSDSNKQQKPSKSTHMPNKSVTKPVINKKKSNSVKLLSPEISSSENNDSSDSASNRISSISNKKENESSGKSLNNNRNLGKHNLDNILLVDKNGYPINKKRIFDVNGNEIQPPVEIKQFNKCKQDIFDKNGNKLKVHVKKIVSCDFNSEDNTPRQVRKKAIKCQKNVFDQTGKPLNVILILNEEDFDNLNDINNLSISESPFKEVQIHDSEKNEVNPQSCFSRSLELNENLFDSDDNKIDLFVDNNDLNTQDTKFYDEKGNLIPDFKQLFFNPIEIVYNKRNHKESPKNIPKIFDSYGYEIQNPLFIDQDNHKILNHCNIFDSKNNDNENQDIRNIKPGDNLFDSSNKPIGLAIFYDHKTNTTSPPIFDSNRNQITEEALLDLINIIRNNKSTENNNLSDLTSNALFKSTYDFGNLDDFQQNKNETTLSKKSTSDLNVKDTIEINFDDSTDEEEDEVVSIIKPDNNKIDIDFDDEENKPKQLGTPKSSHPKISYNIDFDEVTDDEKLNSNKKCKFDNINFDSTETDLDSDNSNYKKSSKQKILIKKKIFNINGLEIFNPLLIDTRGRPLNIQVFNSKGKEIKSSILYNQELFDSSNHKIDCIIEVDIYGQQTSQEPKLFDSEGNQIHDFSFLIPLNNQNFESASFLIESEFDEPSQHISNNYNNPMAIVDENGKPITLTLYDSTGEELSKIEFDQDGQPTRPVFDANGRLIKEFVVENDLFVKTMQFKDLKQSYDSEIEYGELDRNNVNYIYFDKDGNEFPNPIFVDINNKLHKNTKLFDQNGHITEMVIYDPETGIPTIPLFDENGQPISHVIQIGDDGFPTHITIYNMRKQRVIFTGMQTGAHSTINFSTNLNNQNSKLAVLMQKMHSPLIKSDFHNKTIEKTTSEAVYYDNPDIGVSSSDISDEERGKKTSLLCWARLLLSNAISNHLDKAKLNVAITDAQVDLARIEDEIKDLEDELEYLEKTIKLPEPSGPEYCGIIYSFDIPPGEPPDPRSRFKETKNQTETSSNDITDIYTEINTNTEFLARNLIIEQQKLIADSHFPELEKLLLQIREKNSSLTKTVNTLETKLKIFHPEEDAARTSKDSKLRYQFEENQKEKLNEISMTESQISEGVQQADDLKNRIEDQRVLINMIKQRLAEQQRKRRPNTRNLVMKLDSLHFADKQNREALAMLGIEQNYLEEQLSRHYNIINEESFEKLNFVINDSQKALRDLKDTFIRQRKVPLIKGYPASNRSEFITIHEKTQERKKQIADIKRKQSVIYNKIEKAVKTLETYGLRIPIFRGKTDV